MSADARPPHATIALDAVETARPLPEVVDAMRPWLGAHHADPDSPLAAGRAAHRAREAARARIATRLRCDPDRVVFTSGRTEGVALGIRALASAAARDGDDRPVVCAAHEPAPILHAVRALELERRAVRVLPGDRDGRLDPAAIREADPAVLAWSHGHPELGTLAPHADILEAARAGGTRTLVDIDLTFGCDAPRTRSDAPAADIRACGVHRAGGPAGIGVIALREPHSIPPLLPGGTGEGGIRPGLLSTAAIVGAGALADRLGSRSSAAERFAHALYDALRAVPGARPIGPAPAERIPGHVAFAVPGLDSEAIVVRMEREGVLAAAGSPCGHRGRLPSSALRAAGYSTAIARGAVVLMPPPDPGPLPVDRVVGAIVRTIEALGTVAGGDAKAPGLYSSPTD